MGGHFRRATRAGLLRGRSLRNRTQRAVNYCPSDREFRARLSFIQASFAFQSLSLLLCQETMTPSVPYPKETRAVSMEIVVPTSASSFKPMLPGPTIIPSLSQRRYLPLRQNWARISSGISFALSDRDIWRALSRSLRFCQSASISEGSGSPETHSFLSISSKSSSVWLNKRRDISRLPSPRLNPRMSSPSICKTVPSPTQVTEPKFAAQ